MAGKAEAIASFQHPPIGSLQWKTRHLGLFHQNHFSDFPQIKSPVQQLPHNQHAPPTELRNRSLDFGDAATKMEQPEELKSNCRREQRDRELMNRER
ncbi:hypothetical protein Pyn_32033 [Prunus yedoensis var. nudiflora]|uniref:Uncharacterized protein n=1 Tax=Prunus yedoensis var. nudiflora TaxID=2094558 RepID=A0A314XJB3_PRUYE|nr:hypothetical protein Pyn_32033 [Prunus yedoensis var. nudiflora]